MKSKKVIIDTNIWISYLISNKFDKLDDYIIEDKIKLLFSKELFEELLTVVKRPKLSKYISESNITDLVRLFDNYGKLIKVSTNIEKCRDFKDNFLLNLAIDGKADYLITGDEDLLVLKKINKTKILSFNEFIEKEKL